MKEKVRVSRIDIGRLDEAERTPQGYLKTSAYATRIGIFKYQMPDGSIFKELRPPEEVFDQRSLNSLREVVVTNDHPPAMLTSENTKKYQSGFTSDSIEPVHDFVRCRVTITDQETIDDVENGKRETSCGYFCELDKTPGQWGGDPYDAVQRNITYNHLAIVGKGRAGPLNRLHMDAETGVMIKFDSNKRNETGESGGNIMSVKHKIDGIEYEVSPEVAKAVRDEQKAFADTKEKLDASNKSADELKGKVDALEAELKKKDSEIEKLKAQKPSRNDMIKIAKDRIQLESFATKILGEEEAGKSKLDSLEDINIKKMIVSKVYPEMKLDGLSNDHIAGCFSVISTSQSEGKTDGAGKLEKELMDNAGKATGGGSDVEKARLESQKQDSEAWKV